MPMHAHYVCVCICVLGGMDVPIHHTWQPDVDAEMPSPLTLHLISDDQIFPECEALWG